MAAESYWRYAEARQQQAVMAAAAAAGLAPAAATAAAAAPPQAVMAPSAGAPPLKRARPDYADLPTRQDMASYYPRDDDRAGYRSVRENEAIGASYDRYLRNGMPPVGPSETTRPMIGGMSGYPVEDHRMMGVVAMDNRSIGYAARPEPPLPLDASNTLYVEGLPSNCTRREVSHIFRPFVGFREVRLVNKESRHPGGDPHVLCFVDFATPAQAVVALEALQGYKFDEHDRDSANLRPQFSRFPGPRSAGGPRGRR